MKKKMTKTAKTAAVIMMASLLAIGTAGCSQKNDTKEQKASSEAEEKLTEKDLSGVITGLDDHYILENAKNIDYLHGIQYDEGIIKEVKADHKKVDLSKPGKYTATYTVSVDVSALEEYQDAKAEAAKKNADSQKDREESTDNTSTSEKDSENNSSNATDESKQNSDSEKSDVSAEESAENETKAENAKEEDTDSTDTADDEEENIEDLEIDKEIEVVDKDKAEDLADQGEVVWTDDNDTVPKSDGSKVEDKTEETESTKPTDDTTASADTGSNAGTTTGGSGSTDSNENTGSTGGSTSAPSQPTGCSHSWQVEYKKGEAPGYWKEVADYTTVYIYVCDCGKEFSRGEDYDVHAAFDCDLGGYYIDPRQQQTGTHKEWVVTGPAPDVPTGRKICSKCGAVQ